LFGKAMLAGQPTTAVSSQVVIGLRFVIGRVDTDYGHDPRPNQSYCRDPTAIEGHVDEETSKEAAVRIGQREHTRLAEGSLRDRAYDENRSAGADHEEAEANIAFSCGETRSMAFAS
jgi:hypothetical protein